MRLHKGDSTALVAHPQHRILWLQGGVVEGLGKCVKKSLDSMNRNGNQPIWFYLWSLGGSVREEYSIVSAIDASSAPVMTIAFRQVASAALSIFQSGSERYALPHTKLGFHQARQQLSTCPKHGLVIGADECLSVFHNLERANAVTLQQLSRHAKIEKIRLLLAQEATISVAEAIRLGMVNGYFSTKEFNRDHRIIAALYHSERPKRP